jgi:phage tail-like protein
MSAEKEQKPAQTGTSPDPYRGYNFKVVILDVTEGAFTECSGMGVTVQALRYAEGRSPVVRRIPGPVDYADVTLRYGLTSSNELWKWMKTAIAGKVDRKNVSIVLLGPDGSTEVLRWNLNNAWISKWRGAPLDALAQEIAIESITLVYETLTSGDDV